MSLARTLSRIVLSRIEYRRALRRGYAAGDVRRVTSDNESRRSPRVVVRFPADGPAAVSVASAAAWCYRQTLGQRGELALEGVHRDGSLAWQRDRLEEDARPDWLVSPAGLPDVEPSHLESCLLVAAAEDLDAVALADPPAVEGSWREVMSGALRPFCLYRATSFATLGDEVVQARRTGLSIAKVIDRRWGGEPARDSTSFTAVRRGPYRSNRDPGPCLTVRIRDAARVLRRQPRRRDRIPLVVTAPFLATGGAEHTLYETLAVLVEEFDVTIATLAPHAPERGDRRDDFRRLTDRVFCVGDLVHPDAMEGILVDLLRASGAEILYNANGTTLFYDLAPRLKRRQPSLRIVDHLYDHRVGYIEWYTPAVRDTVDMCIAENTQVAAALVSEHGWPPERVPVIWPCGRRPEALPAPAERAAVRARLRAELGLTENAVVFVTAARMHEQKRPLDLVRLADRVRDLASVQFLVVGGGALADAVDDAIAATAGAPIRRLPFRDDIPELLLAADVGCLVSAYEGLPVFLLECLQLGLPFLGTDVGDLGEVLRATGAGLVVDSPGDLDALEAAVRRLAEPALRTELGRRAIAAAGRFDPTACAAAYRAALLGA